MKQVYRRVLALLVLALAAGGARAAAPVAEPGAAWREDGAGGWRGSGRDFGRGYAVHEDGRRLSGTGRDFGRGWRQGADGAWHGTGANFGRRLAPRR